MAIVLWTEAWLNRQEQAIDCYLASERMNIMTDHVMGR